MKRFLSLIVIIIFLGVSLLSGASNSAQEKDFRKAKRHIHKKEWKKAVKVFDSLLSDTENYKTGETLYWKGFSLNKLSRNKNRGTQIELKEEALESLEELIKSYPENRWTDDAKILTVSIAGDLASMGLIKYKNYVDAGARNRSNMELKLAALNAMMSMDPKRAYPALEKIIRTSPHYTLRKKAIFIVSQIKDPKVVKLLVEVAKKDKNLKLRAEAIFWLTQRAPISNELTKELIEIYKTTQEISIKKKIVFSVSQMRVDNRVELLEQLYNLTDNMKIKKNILFWMGQLKDPKATEFIMKVLED